MHQSSGLLRRIAALLALALLAGCQAWPTPGEHVVLHVLSIPNERVALQDRPELTLAIARGVTRQEVRDGRLMRGNCYVDMAPGRVVQRFGFVLLPSGLRLQAGTIVDIDAESADDRPLPYTGYFGRYVGTAGAAPDEYFDSKVWTHLYRCPPVGPDGRMRVALSSRASTWDWEFAAAEADRNSHISDVDLRVGRIVLAQCSPGADSWAPYKVRLPAGLSVQPGDFIEAVAGAMDGGVDRGDIAVAIRRVQRPPPGAFIGVQGSRVVSCHAPAIPLPAR